MRCIIAFLLVSICFAGLSHAQTEDDEIACFADRGKENSAFKKKLWDGYEISLGPARNSMGGGDECTAAIYNKAGKVVYRTTGFNVVFDQDETGEDFDGDGHPEVVFKTDTGGGMHCCWVYNVISLQPQPHKLVDIGQSGAVDFRKDKHGRMVIWAIEPGPYGYTSMAENPYAQKVFRVSNGKLADVTPEYCAAILQGEGVHYAAAKQQLTPERVRRFKSGRLALDSSEGTETASAVLTLALQHVFCRQFDQAAADLELWPDTTKAKMKADFARSIRLDFPDFAARLAGQGHLPAEHDHDPSH